LFVDVAEDGRIDKGMRRIMSRIQPVAAESASPETQTLLGEVKAKFGMTPNVMATMGHSAAVLEGYLNFSGALAKGVLSARLREQIALAVGQANSCEYCLSAHTASGKRIGLSTEEMANNRRGVASDPKAAVALRFAQDLVIQRGEVDDAALRRLRGAGYTETEIVEIVANVAVNIFTNYFNHVAQTDVDFPRVTPALAA
jgi:uncharacterized peroxidase-related enzyme